MEKLGKRLQEGKTEKSKMLHELMKMEDRKMLIGFIQLELMVHSLLFTSYLVYQATFTDLTSSAQV